MSPITTLARQLWFVAPGQVEVRTAALPEMLPGQVLVATECSAISAGTELLVYRGQLPQDLALDATITSLQQHAGYPLRYGYSCVGRVTAVGSDVDAQWLGQRVFAFQPHASHFVAAIAELIVVPDDVPAEKALLLPNLETAVNLVHDGNPLLGEQVVVLGQGIVGLLLTALLAQHPLQRLSVCDRFAARRDQALRLGATDAFDPSDEAAMTALRQQLANAASAGGADLIFEVSGAPAALNQAIDLSGYASRIVIGSWYGTKSAPITLGGAAHRNRLQIITSQVSTLAPALSGRWDKQRRFEQVWALLRTLDTSELITHRLPLQAAPALYRQLDAGAPGVVQAVFEYAPDRH